MSTRIPRLSAVEMEPQIAWMLRPRIERLGFLGEFFQCAANQPRALEHFLKWTEELKHALPENLTEVVALTVAQFVGNAYERIQHERLSLKLGYSKQWLLDVLSLRPETGSLNAAEKAVQALVIATAGRNGHN